MIVTYFKTTLRYLRKSKIYAIVNILGLGVGILSCLLIGIYIMDELSFDRFHKNAERIVRVTWEYKIGEGEVNKVSTTGTKVGPEFTRRFPEAEAYTRIIKSEKVISYQKKVFEEPNFLYADSAFFSIFSFSLLQGDIKNALNAPDKLVLTNTAAKKYFGNEDAVGKTLKIGSKDFTITGVAADPPSNSQIKFDFVGSFTSLNASKEEKWTEANYVTYLLLKSNDLIPNLQSKIDLYVKNVARDEMKLTGSQYMGFHLEPLTSVHLYSKLDGLEPNNSITYIYIFAAIALLILLIACVNYTNLSTAQSAGRNAEIGMRKVMGAGKHQIFYQFLTESFLLTLFGVILALFAAIYVLPYFNELSGKSLSTSMLFAPATILALILLCVFITLAAGAYPSFILSQSKVLALLKTGFNFTGSNTLRKSLIVVQFVISVFLIISTIVILQQLSYIKNKDVGYNKEHIVVLPVDNQTQERYDDIKKAFAAVPGVTSIGGAYEEPTHVGWGDGITSKGGEKVISVAGLPVDEDFIKTMDIKLISGNHFTQTDVQQFDTSNDDLNLKYSFMLNESAAKSLGWKPEEAVGKIIMKGREGTVKAVVKDFHFRSFHEPISPMLIFLDKRLVRSYFIKIHSANISQSIANLERVWKQRINHRPFDYHFLDEDFNALYKAEERTASVFTTFSVMAILLACLGLFGLTAYAMARRTKEIGIRKILGASIADILSLVSKDFLKLVCIAFVIAIPIAFFSVNKWLEGFSYKISVGWWVYAIAGVVTLIIAFTTICLQAIKTAATNPVKNLRTE